MAFNCSGPNTWFVSYAFKDFKDLLVYTHNIITLLWIALELDLNMSWAKCLVFQCVNQTFYATYPNYVIRRPRLVIIKTYIVIFQKEK
jgi:hypothetical protein